MALKDSALCASTTRQESAGEYLDNSAITARAKTECVQERSLKPAESNVETFKRIVQLSGFVNSQADIHKAVEIARDMPGVVSVKNDMRLK